MPTGIPFKTEEARKAGERARSRRYRQNHLEARRKSVRAATCKVRANQTPEERAAVDRADKGGAAPAAPHQAMNG